MNIQGDGECGRQLSKGDLEAYAKDRCNQQAFARDCAFLCHGSLRAVSAKEGLRFKDFAQRCGRKVIPAATAAFITSVVTSVEHVGALMPPMFRSRQLVSGTGGTLHGYFVMMLNALPSLVLGPRLCGH